MFELLTEERSPAKGPWFAIQTRHRHEKMVTRQLHYKGYELFLPMYVARRKWSDRIKTMQVPLFDGYFFCRLDRLNTASVILTPGVIRIVGTASRPIAVDEAEIEALQRLVASNQTLEPWPYLRIGQRVRIEVGALTGVEGVLQDLRGRSRLIVSITLLQRSVAVEIDRDDVTPVEVSDLSRVLA